MSPGPTVLLVDNQTAAFLSHRLPLAQALLRQGCTVHVAVPEEDNLGYLQEAGLIAHHLPLDRGGINPFQELHTISSLRTLIRRIKPDVVHLKSPKIWCYGGIICRLTGVPAVVSHVVGLGFAATGTGLKARIARLVMSALVKVAFGHHNQRVLVQNRDDQSGLPAAGCPAAKIRLVRGSGVNTAQFCPTPLPPGPPLVVLPARMLFDKGIREFVDAAHMLHEHWPAARFALVGGIDPGNPMSAHEDELRAWHGHHGVEWWGHQTDMIGIYQQAAIVCLPSWREGLPRALLEAMACGRPVVAADAPGTREPVNPGVTGLLAPVRSADGLAHAIEQLLANPQRAQSMGAAGRKEVEREFDLPITIARTLAVFAEVCPAISGRPPSTDAANCAPSSP